MSRPFRTLTTFILCIAVTDGTCTACTTAAAIGCTAVTCATNRVDTNGNAADGCEDSCAAVTDGNITVCATASALRAAYAELNQCVVK